MAVTLILGDTFQAAYEGVLADLKDNLNKYKNHSHIFLVPDKFSLTLEKSILTALGLSASVNIRVLSFTRFAAVSLKNKINKCLTPEGSVMLLQKVINRKQEELTCYKSVCRRGNFAGEVYAAITLFRNSGITVERLKAGLKKIERPHLKQKIKDIVTLYEGYLAELSDSRNDSSTRLERFAEFIPELDNIASSHIYLSDFFQFTAPQYEILRQLAVHAATLTAGLVEGTGENRRLYPHAAINGIKTLAEESGVGLNVKRVTGEVKPSLRFIRDNLFGYADESIEITDGSVELFSAGDAFGEVERVASQIKKLIIEKGYRYMDIAVVVGDMQLYTPVFHTVFKRFDIPYFLDVKRMLSEQAPVRFLKSAVEVWSSSFRREEVLDFVKNPFFGSADCGADEVDDFENYVVKYNINYSRFNNPFSIDDEFLERAERVRERLHKLVPRFKKSDSADGYINTVNSFFVSSGYYGRLARFALEQERLDQPFFSKITVQVEEKLTAVFQEIADTIGREQFGFADFYRILSGMLDTVKIALAPLFIDSVFVGDFNESRFERVKTLFVVGAAEGKIPSENSGRAILSFKDEEGLQLADILLKPDKKTANLYERFYLSQLLAGASDGVKISCPKTVMQEKQNASVLFGLLQACFTEGGKPLKIKGSGEEFLSDGERAKAYGYKFGSQSGAYFELLGKVVSERVPSYGMEPYDAAFHALSRERQDEIAKYLSPCREVEKIDGGKLFLNREYISISQLETYFYCPYKHYFRYGLRILKQPDGTVQSTDTGTFVHAVLEAYFKRFAEGAPMGGEDECERAVNQITGALLESEPYKRFCSDKKQKSVYARISRECVGICLDLTNILRRSAFKPKYTEAAFGRDKDSAFDGIMLDVNGSKLKLIGFIDRIDVCRDMFYIIDYKTFNKETSFKDIYYGSAIQLIAYLGAAAEQGNMRPAGAYYLPVTTGYRLSGESRYKVSGYTLNDSEVAALIDGGLTERGKSDYLGVYLNKDGTLKNNSGLVGAEDFSALTDYVKKLTEQAAAEIAEGNLEARPYAERSDEKCGFCDYKSICAFSERAAARKPRAVKLDDVRRAADV